MIVSAILFGLIICALMAYSFLNTKKTRARYKQTSEELESMMDNLNKRNIQLDRKTNMVIGFNLRHRRNIEILAQEIIELQKTLFAYLSKNID